MNDAHASGRGRAKNPASATPRHALLLADNDSDTKTVIHAGLVHHGFAVDIAPRVAPGESLARAAAWHARDLILLYGPHNGSMSCLVPHLTELRRRPDGPLVVWWLLENLPASPMPDWVTNRLAALRLVGDRHLAHAAGRWRAARRVRWLYLGQRFRILGELIDFWRRGLVDVVAAPSEPRSDALRRRGIPAVTVPFGFHSTFGRDLKLPRDLDALFLGQLASRRRRRIVARLERELGRRGLGLTIAGANGYLDGEARTALACRAKVLLNVLKAPGDGVQHRFLLGAATGTLVVSEPMADSGFFQPGVHFISAPVPRLAATVAHWCQADHEREKITARCQRFATEQLGIERSIGSILDACREPGRRSRGPAPV